MKKLILCWSLFLGCAALQIPTTFANGSPCVKSAQDLQRSCQFAAAQERKQTLANCRHLSEGPDRRECRAEAIHSFPEAQHECAAQWDARVQACELLGEFRYDLDPLLDPSNTFVDPEDIGEEYPANPYVSLVAGRTLVLRGGEAFEELVVIHVTDDVREILGVECRVVADVVVEIGEDEDGLEYFPVEVTDDWFAQTTQGDVFYCGESVRDFEDGVITSIDGAFEAGKDFAKAGLLIAANPIIGSAHRTEFALGEAEDIVQYLELSAAPGADEGGENPAVSCAAAGGCLKTLDSAPLSPESTEYKYYLAGVGFVLAVNLEDGEIIEEREELVCAGDSLQILESAACGIEDPGELLEELCELNAEAFCD